MIRLLRIVWLTAMWVALWSDISLGNILAGLVIAAVIVALFDTWRPGHLIIRPVAAIRFGMFFLYQLTVSSLAVTRAVIAPRNRVQTGIIAVPLRGCSDGIVTLIADAITLTPGTLTLEVRRDPLTLFVHALDVRDIAVLQREIRKLEVLAIKAFGDGDAIAGIAEDTTSVWRSR